MKRLALGPTSIAALVLFALLVGDLIFRPQLRAPARALADRGVTTTAIVDVLRIESMLGRDGAGRRRAVGRLATSFGVPARGSSERQVVEVEHDIPRSPYESLSSTDQVKLRDFPENPTDIEAFPGGAAGLSGFLRRVALTLGSALGLLVYVQARLHRTADDLARNGMTKTGVVEMAHKARKVRSLQIRCIDGPGKEHGVLTAPVDAPRWLHLMPGTTLLVRCDPERPTSVALA